MPKAPSPQYIHADVNNSAGVHHADTCDTVVGTVVQRIPGACDTMVGLVSYNIGINSSEAAKMLDGKDKFKNSKQTSLRSLIGHTAFRLW